MPDRLEKTVADFLRRQDLFAGAGRILLAVSGGADSIALLSILAALKAQGRLGPDLVCAHINHQLRGPASDADEQFVVGEATRLGLPVVARAIDVRTHAQTRGLSLETAARQLRLAGLAEIAHSQGCTWVCTGHQKNDTAETLVHRLWRGTGFRGLAGIRPARRFGDLQLASPLLCATRREIVAYLEEHRLRWREDQTNTEIIYTRNFIRHRLLPFLQEEASGSLVEELSDLAAAANRLCRRVEREADAAWSAFVKSAAGDVIIRASGLSALPELVAVELIRRAVANLAGDQGNLAESHYRSILRLTRNNAGGKKVPLPGGLLVQREGEQLALRVAACRVGLAPPISSAMTLQVPGLTPYSGYQITANLVAPSEVDAATIGRDKGPFIEYLDLDRVQPPVVVQSRRPGDRFQPLGMPDEKKVGKFLTTAKVSRDLREQILVFADQERIVWVCPVRLSEQVKITERTRRVLQLTVRHL
jgi:tRNA(Ile)-lysidine synthase